MHDTAGELAQPFDVKEWRKGQCELIPGKTALQIAVVERDYLNVFKRFTALGPLMDKLGNGGKGIAWKTGTEVAQLGQAEIGVLPRLVHSRLDLDASATPLVQLADPRLEPTVPDELLLRLQRFQTDAFPQHRSHCRLLVDDGQHPLTLFIGCSDSRLPP